MTWQFAYCKLAGNVNQMMMMSRVNHESYKTIATYPQLMMNEELGS